MPFDPHTTTTATSTASRRLDGTRSFLQSRGIELPEGTPDDPPGTQTIYGLSNRKNELVLQKLDTDGVQVYDGSITYIKAVRATGIATAIVSSSANTKQVLDSAGIADLFDFRMDGVVAERELTGKPAPDTYLAAAERSSASPRPRGGVRGRAGRRRGRAGRATSRWWSASTGSARRHELHEHGADVVVQDLAELLDRRTG